MDYIVRGTAADHQIRFFAAHTRETVEHARFVHQTSPVVTAALGRLMTAAAMMGVMMKGEKDLLTLQIKSDGPIEGLVVTADSKARVKGYPYHAIVDIPLKNKGKLDVSRAVGNGKLTIIKDVGLKDAYIGQTNLVSGEIAEDLTFYFANSEQIPSVVALGVLVDRDYTVKESGGFIIQLLPGAEPSVVDFLEKKLQEVTSVTALLNEGKTPEEIIEFLLGELGVELMEKVETNFYCNCSKERVEKALISVGKKDLEELIQEAIPVALNCHFCNEKYVFSLDELKEIRSNS